MRVGLVTFDMAGHLNPLCTLGQELSARGHEVLLIGGRFAQSYADRFNLAHVPVGVVGDRDLEVRDLNYALGELTGITAMRQTGKIMATMARIHLDELSGIVRKEQIDALVLDQLTPAASHVAEQLSIPFVIACNALATFASSNSPPPPLPWRYKTGVLGRLRNKFAIAAVRPLYHWFADAKRTGVCPLRHVFESESGLARLVQQPEFFDFPNQLPESFHYTAPWHLKERNDDCEFPWDRLDGRPLIYASMGTLQNNLTRVFATIMDAVADLDMQVVLSMGGAPHRLREAPKNVLLVERAPQLQLLQRVQLAITHAGLNTVLECIASGVPMVCLPVTNDQPGVARRVEYLGLGQMVMARSIKVHVLKRMLLQANDNQAYRLKAKECAKALGRKNGPAMAADIFELAMSKGRPILRSDLAATQHKTVFHKA